MAKKGTYGALRSQGKQADFGEAARTVAGDVESKRQSILKEELLKSQQETEKMRYADKLRKESYNDMIAFSKEAKDMMDIDTSGMLNPVLTEVLKTSQNRYANMMREFKTASTGRRAELNIEMNRYKSISKNINSMGEGINAFFKDFASTANGKPKYSKYGSSKTVLGTIQAIKAAATQGLKKNSDGTYSWGDKITIENMGTPDMKLRIMGADGKQLAYNSMESITSSLSSGLKPYNDFGSDLRGMASKVDATVRTKVDINNTTLAYNKAIDVPATMTSINATLDTYLGSDDSDRMKELIVNGHYGKTPNEIRKSMAKSMFDMQKKVYDTKLAKNPTLQAKIKKDANDEASASARQVILGDTTAIDQIKGKVWSDTKTLTNVDDPEDKNTVANGKVVDIDVNTDDEIITVKLLRGKGQTYEMTYDRRNQNDMNKFAQNVLQARQGITGKTPFDLNTALKNVDYSNIAVKGFIGPEPDAVSGAAVSSGEVVKESYTDTLEKYMNDTGQNEETAKNKLKEMGIEPDKDYIDMDETFNVKGKSYSMKALQKSFRKKYSKYKDATEEQLSQVIKSLYKK